MHERESTLLMLILVHEAVSIDVAQIQSQNQKFILGSNRVKATKMKEYCSPLATPSFCSILTGKYKHLKLFSATSFSYMYESETLLGHSGKLAFSSTCGY